MHYFFSITLRFQIHSNQFVTDTYQIWMQTSIDLIFSFSYTFTNKIWWLRKIWNVIALIFSFYRYILEFPDFKFGAKSQHTVFFQKKKIKSVTLHCFATTKTYIPLFFKYVLHLHLKNFPERNIRSSFLFHFLKWNFGHGIGQLFI